MDAESSDDDKDGLTSEQRGESRPDCDLLRAGSMSCVAQALNVGSPKFLDFIMMHTSVHSIFPH